MGGGSTIDTCKAVNLLTCHPAPLLDYINKPVGKGVPVPGPLRPLIAVPTTAGTGSETTAVAVTHVLDQNVKAGVSHRLLRPALGIVDPLNTLTVPPGGDGGGGRRHPHPRHRVVHDAPVQRAPQAPPARSARLHRRQPGQRHLVREGDRVRRRATCGAPCSTASTSRRALHLALAANYAGIGFGNAGVHIPHAVAYPIAGLVRDYVPSGYRTRHPLVPHGMSVILTAPAAFRFTYATAPERHLRAAELMGVPVAGLVDAERREALPQALLVAHAGRRASRTGSPRSATASATCPR